MGVHGENPIEKVLTTKTESRHGRNWQGEKKTRHPLSTVNSPNHEATDKKGGERPGQIPAILAQNRFRCIYNAPVAVTAGRTMIRADRGV